MPATDFLDSNVVIYSYATDQAKKSRALDLLAGSPTISTQVINETVSVLRRKQLMPVEQIATAIDDLTAWCHVFLVDISTIKQALDLAARYRLSYFDALMVAAAIGSGCTTLYSEDMHHGLVVDGVVTIQNPFQI
ncbi:MAG: PIN domain-containing protein [Azonexus sp.]|jgi:predicted nucleic acid-binding protein|nr:PIN domain-containing protein [Azonexus sp.]